MGSVFRKGLSISLMLIGLVMTSLRGELPSKEAIHEAFCAPDCNVLYFESVPLQPPEPMKEKVAGPQDAKMQWISGYWIFLKEKGNFYWVSGVWRIPPPGMKWVNGRWTSTSEGWVRERGFWSPVGEKALKSIPKMPPEPLDEQAPTSPGDDFLWVRGYWKWDSLSEQFQWHHGYWEKRDQWVYTPECLMWRGDNLYFVPGYWDLPLEKRGKAYEGISILPYQGTPREFHPTIEVNPQQIWKKIAFYWPNYLSLFQYQWETNPEQVAKLYTSTPYWWKWSTWWTFGWDQQWALWWWWTHPEYLNPSWITPALAAEIVPADEELIVNMRGVTPPLNVTPNGVVDSSVLMQAMRKVLGEQKIPILPTDPREILDIQEVASPTQGPPPTQFLRPTGTASSSEEESVMPQKPVLGPPLETLPTPPQKAAPLPKPASFRDKKSLSWLERRHVPRKRQIAYSRPDDEPLPDQQVQTPYHGEKPDYEYPQIPQATQDKGYRMNTPQPQQNPAGYPSAQDPSGRFEEGN